MIEKQIDPLVSIIIPVYNGSNYLERAIRSAINQTYPNIEIIVVNDGSDDNGRTRDVALGFGDRIFYFEKENGGVSSAFNYGISKMKGEYFSWLSHDDEYYPYKIEKQIEYLRNLVNKKIILYSQVITIDSNSKSITKKGRATIPVVKPEKVLFYILTYRPFINGNTVLIPRTCFKEVGMFDESLRTSQDYDLWFRLALKYDFHLINEKLVKSRIHSEQGSKLERSFINESKMTKIKQICTLDPSILTKLTEEDKYEDVIFKLIIKYILNGGENAGWPVNFLRTNFKISLLRRVVIAMVIILMKFRISRKPARLLIANRFKFKMELK